MTQESKILVAESGGANVLKFVGDIRMPMAPTLAAWINRIGTSDDIKSIVIDLSEAESIDSTMLGYLAKISLRCQEAFSVVPTIFSTNENVTRILLSMGFDDLFAIVGEIHDGISAEGELPTRLVPEHVLCEQVIEAHRILMGMNESNEATFRDLVDCLEGEQEQHPRKHVAAR